MKVISSNVRFQMVTALGTFYTDGEVRLFQNDITPTPSIVLGDFTEADFAGYAAVEIADSLTGLNNGDGSWFVVPDVLPSFQPAALVTPQTVFGWYITTDGGADVLCADRFDEPFEFASDSDILIVENLRISLGLSPILDD